LLGFDVLIDGDGSPILLEVNANPYLFVPTPLDVRVKQSLLETIFGILDILPSVNADPSSRASETTNPVSDTKADSKSDSKSDAAKLAALFENPSGMVNEEENVLSPPSLLGPLNLSNTLLTTQHVKDKNILVFHQHADFKQTFLRFVRPGHLGLTKAQLIDFLRSYGLIREPKEGKDDQKGQISNDMAGSNDDIRAILPTLGWSLQEVERLMASEWSALPPPQQEPHLDTTRPPVNTPLFTNWPKTYDYAPFLPFASVCWMVLDHIYDRVSVRTQESSSDLAVRVFHCLRSTS